VMVGLAVDDGLDPAARIEHLARLRRVFANAVQESFGEAGVEALCIDHRAAPSRTTPAVTARRLRSPWVEAWVRQ